MATDPAACKSLFKRYTEEILIPTAVNLKKHLSAIEAGGDPDAHDGDQHAHLAQVTALSEDKDENAAVAPADDDSEEGEADVKTFSRR